MNWTILNVSIPVYDLQKSKQFYDMLIGYNENQEILYQTLYKNEENIFFGNNGCGKTNILEGISLISKGRGIRYVNIQNLRKNNQNFTHLDM